MTALRILNLLIWSGLFLYMLPGAWAVARSKNVRRGDPMRLSVAAVCLVIILGNLRWLVAPESDELFVAIYVLSAIVGVFKIVLARVYGRGPAL